MGTFGAKCNGFSNHPFKLFRHNYFYDVEESQLFYKKDLDCFISFIHLFFYHISYRCRAFIYTYPSSNYTVIIDNLEYRFYSLHTFHQP